MHGPARTPAEDPGGATGSAGARRLRLGVLTFHRAINYGSLWQARCLVNGLRGLGHDAELLDHRDAAIDRAEWRCALQPLLPVRSGRDDRRRHAAKARSFARSLARLPRSAPLAPGVIPNLYDAVVVGSDEVWNRSHPWYGGSGLFWGEGLAGQRLIAYAASCGNHGGPLSASDEDALRGFERIAVRDRTTRDLVHRATGQEPPLVLDPVLQFPPPPAPPLLRSPYALVYGHEFPEWIGPAARDWAARRGLRLLSVGYRAEFADEQWLEATPEGFACAVAGAAAILTSMFHGSVFGLNAGKPFVAVPSQYRAAKLTDLLDGLGAASHLLCAPTPLAPLLDASPDPAIFARLAGLRRQSHAVLEAALG